MSDFIAIPYQQLSAETLDGLIEAYIMREGTDYGDYEYSLSEKLAQVKQALIAGQAEIVFDPISESCTLIDKNTL